MATELNRNDKLYEIGMSMAKRRIEKSPFYICVLIKGRENSDYLLDQINHAKSLGKAFYIIMEEGADPSILFGADIRGIFYYSKNEQESLEKSVERVSKSMVEQVLRDFPVIKSQPSARTVSQNGIVKLQPRQ